MNKKWLLQIIGPLAIGIVFGLFASESSFASGDFIILWLIYVLIVWRILSAEIDIGKKIDAASDKLSEAYGELTEQTDERLNRVVEIFETKLEEQVGPTAGRTWEILSMYKKDHPHHSEEEI